MLGFLCRICGRVVYASIFIIAGVTHSQEFQTFTQEISKDFPAHLIGDAIRTLKLYGMPATWFSGQPIEIAAMASIALMTVGGGLIATRLLPRFGSLLVLVFLAAATYYEHILPMRAATDEKRQMMEMMMAMKNVSLAGAAIMLFGYEASSGPVKFIGRVVFCIIFLASAGHHATAIPDMAKMIQNDFPLHLISKVVEASQLKGLPPAAEIAAMGAIILMGLGGLFVSTGILPRLGCCLLIGFLMPATYYQHFLPLKAADQFDDKLIHFEMIMVLKNVSIMGAAVMLFGYESIKPDAPQRKGLAAVKKTKNRR